MQIRDLVGWAAWGSDGIESAATAEGGPALVGLRIFGHEGTLAGCCLYTGPVVAVDCRSGAWVVRTASGSLYRLLASLPRAQECESQRMLRAA